MRFLSDKRGQIFATGVLATLLLIVAAAATIDGLHMLSLKQRCIQIASAAALRGASVGRDYGSYMTGGQIELDSAVAQDEAFDAADAALAALGLSGYTVQVQVLDESGGGSVGNFPPGQTWTESKPSVGVYLEVAGETVFMQAVMAAPVTLHAFAAAGVETE